VTIRARLTLWYLVVLCVGMTVFAGAVLLQVDRSAEESLDGSLRQSATDIMADLTVGHTIVLKNDVLDSGDHDLGAIAVWVRVLNAAGSVVIRQGPTVPLAVGTRLDQRVPGFYSLHSARGDAVRMYVQAVTVNGRRVATVQALTTTQELEGSRHRLLVAMGLAGAIIVTLAAAGGYFLAKRALQPVDRVTRIADLIGGGDLHRRVGEEMDGRQRPRQNDEIGRLITTFDRMLARLEEARERRRRLTADVAHELNTPIAIIASGSEIALRHPRSESEYEAVLRHVLDESRHMGKVVEDLLTLARVDEGKLIVQHELVELDEVSRQVARALGPLAVERHIHLSIDVPDHAVIVEGDELRLTQVLRNLLHNALRYTPEGGSVRLVLADTGVGDEWIEIRVEDTGPGIVEHEREHIFERYERAARPQRDGSDGGNHVAGSGLGLAISKAIVASHAGTIHVESTMAQSEGTQSGSVFIVRLPAPRDSNGDE
jgi:two-component system OmpR family sensor kinase